MTTPSEITCSSNRSSLHLQLAHLHLHRETTSPGVVPAGESMRWYTRLQLHRPSPEQQPAGLDPEQQELSCAGSESAWQPIAEVVTATKELKSS